MPGITRFTCALFKLKLTKNVQRNILLSYVLLLSPRVCTPLKTSALTIYISRLLNTPFSIHCLIHDNFCLAGTLLFIIMGISKRIIYLTTRRKMVIFCIMQTSSSITINYNNTYHTDFNFRMDALCLADKQFCICISLQVCCSTKVFSSQENVIIWICSVRTSQVSMSMTMYFLFTCLSLTLEYKITKKIRGR